MGDYLKRVIEEKAELDAKRDRLTRFISSPMYKGLPAEERNLLCQQQITMDSYSIILGDRIKASPFAGESPKPDVITSTQYLDAEDAAPLKPSRLEQGNVESLLARLAKLKLRAELASLRAKSDKSAAELAILRTELASLRAELDKSLVEVCKSAAELVGLRAEADKSASELSSLQQMKDLLVRLSGGAG